MIRSLTCACVVATPLAAQEPAQEVHPAPAVSASAIDSAIALGQSGKQGAGMVVGAAYGDGSTYYITILQGPLGRVVTASAAHAKRYLPFTADSVSPALVAPVLTVMIEPQKPRFSGRWIIPAPVVHVVLQTQVPKGQAPVAPVQPLSTERTTTTYTVAGGTTQVGGMAARFDQALIPGTAFDVVVITDGGEYRTTIEAKRLGELR